MLFKIIILALISCSVKTEDYVRSTNNGLVKGIYSFPLNAWLGIPFAEKPIDDLRFKHPIAKTNWSGILSTANNMASCTESEDCLYLNVFTPVISENLPVLVWIHGGAFTGGSARDDQNNLKKFSMQTNTIVVSIAYRLSIFGFLYMGTENAPGNMGLMDQAMAIKWVHENIHYFGGDISRITVSSSIKLTYILISFHF
jgi:para-nitrobenzyl esterase